MSFTVPRSEAPNKLLVHYTGSINHCAFIIVPVETGLLKWTTSMVGKMLIIRMFREKSTQMLTTSDSFHKILKVSIPSGRKDWEK